jgi:hypothetical protein
MTTKLTFEAPADFSVGRVAVQNERGFVKEWIATPGNKTLELDDAAPGIYTAEIEPVGLRARSFIFEVTPGTNNIVAAPLFAALIAGGNVVAFSGVSDPKAAIESLQRARKEMPLAATRERSIRTEAVEFPTKAESSSKILSIGLSYDESATRIGGWRPFTACEPNLWLEENGLNVMIDLPQDLKATYARLRLSLSLEGVRVERFMVPLFRGGTQVMFRPSPLTTTDVAIQVMPIDAERRALIRALQAGGGDETRAVFADVLRGGAIDRFLGGEDEDPWAAIVAALLTIRFPDVFGPKPPSWGPWLVGHHGWAPDTHVIHARHHLVSSADSFDARMHAGQNALDELTRAQDIGSPYFSCSNQLMGEMLSGLAAMPEQYKALAERANEQLAKWRRNLPLQRSVGAIFSWQMPDPTSRKQQRVLEPFQKTRGWLNERYSSVIFRGTVDLSRISVASASENPPPPEAEKTDRAAVVAAETPPPPRQRSPDVPEAPALSRPIEVANDANKRRFGGLASRNGYTLSATFAEAERSDWVRIELTVLADASRAPSYTDTVEFFLHSTFSPSRVQATFRGHRASLSVKAWGGFTVGAWLPKSQTELECDLAELPDAPRIIREL